MTDTLDGFRDSSLSLARKVESLKPDDFLWHRLYLGNAASKLMQGIAERSEIAKVMAVVIAQCEYEVQSNCMKLLKNNDPDSPAAREAHFNARVASGILGKINHLIRDGETAAQEINSKGET